MPGIIRWDLRSFLVLSTGFKSCLNPLLTSLRGGTPSVGHYFISLSGSCFSRDATHWKNTINSLLYFFFPICYQQDNCGIVAVRHNDIRVLWWWAHQILRSVSFKHKLQNIISICQVLAFLFLFLSISHIEVWVIHSPPVIKMPLSCFACLLSCLFIYLFIYSLAYLFIYSFWFPSSCPTPKANILMDLMYILLFVCIIPNCVLYFHTHTYLIYINSIVLQI